MFEKGADSSDPGIPTTLDIHDLVDFVDMRIDGVWQRVSDVAYAFLATYTMKDDADVSSAF
jgi:hypothetical protein